MNYEGEKWCHFLAFLGFSTVESQTQIPVYSNTRQQGWSQEHGPLGKQFNEVV